MRNDESKLEELVLRPEAMGRSRNQVDRSFLLLGVLSFARVAFANRLAPGTDILANSIDYPNAYENAPVLDPQVDLASTILAASGGMPHVATLRSTPFGSR